MKLSLKDLLMTARSLDIGGAESVILDFSKAFDTIFL